MEVIGVVLIVEVVKMDFDVLISVWSSLFMLKTNSMSDLVLSCSCPMTPRAKTDLLFSSIHTDIRPAPRALEEFNIIWLIGAFNEFQTCSFVVNTNCIIDHILAVGKA